MSGKRKKAKKKPSQVRRLHAIKRHYFSRQENWSRTLRVLKHHNNADVDTASYEKIMMRPYLSYAQLRSGNAQGDDIAVLVQSFSFTQGLLMRFRDFSNLREDMSAMMVEIDAAEEALNALAKRKEERGSFVATGEELKAIQRCLGILDGLVEVSTLNHLSAALQYSIDDMNKRRDRYHAAEAEQERLESHTAPSDCAFA